MEPKNENNKESEIKNIEYESKTVRDDKIICLMCPECFDIVGTIKQKLEVEFFSNKNGKKKIYGHNIRFMIDGYCDTCDQYIDEFIEIDADIAATISLLNQKGWKTLFCCAGHENSTLAYIYFKNNKYLKYIKTVPNGWKIDVKDYTIRKEFIIRAKYNCYDKYELYDWAESLPMLEDVNKLKTISDEELSKILLDFSKDQLDFNDEEIDE